MSKSPFDKLRKLALEELSKLKDEIIVKNPDGYTVFNRYNLKFEDDEYKVYENDRLAAILYTSASAVAWCMATIKGQHKLATDIVKTDTIVNNKRNEHDFYLARIAIAKTDETRDMYRAKWEENYIRLKHYRNEMRKLIEIAKYINS